MKYLRLILLVVIIAVLAACGGTDDNTSTPTDDAAQGNDNSAPNSSGSATTESTESVAMADSTAESTEMATTSTMSDATAESTEASMSGMMESGTSTAEATSGAMGANEATADANGSAEGTEAANGEPIFTVEITGSTEATISNDEGGTFTYDYEESANQALQATQTTNELPVVSTYTLRFESEDGETFLTITIPDTLGEGTYPVGATAIMGESTEAASNGSATQSSSSSNNSSNSQSGTGAQTGGQTSGQTGGSQSSLPLTDSMAQALTTQIVAFAEIEGESYNLVLEGYLTFDQFEANAIGGTFTFELAVDQDRENTITVNGTFSNLAVTLNENAALDEVDSTADGS